MNIAENWEGKISLPEYVVGVEKVGANSITRVAFTKTTIDVKINVSEYPGHDIIETELSAPFDKVLLRRSGANRLSSYDLLYLELKDKNFSYETLDQAFRFGWGNFIDYIDVSVKSPEQINESWRGKFNFKLEVPESEILGLRSPQLGAIHAISAYFSVGQNHEPATVVLPTGTGKTETMLSCLIYNRPDKLLILVPSNALRDQIFDKFVSLGILPTIGVTPTNIFRPHVAKISHGIRSRDEANELIEKSNVIIATPYVFNNTPDEILNAITNKCTDLYIDEAHHSSAKTWKKVREKFEGKRVVQFTATPFRRDGQHIGGKIIFYFKLGDAQRANYFKPIRLHEVEEYGTQEERDRAIASKAIEILRNDIEVHGHDHILMARTNQFDKADNLLPIYQELGEEFNPIVVHSNNTNAVNEYRLNQLLTRGSRIVICVDMLGEGYDLPNLKVVAIHDGHKSIAITLQFIGRFTRVARNVGNAAAVINLAEPKSEEHLQKLYSQGANWDMLLRRMSEDRIEQEIRLQDVIEGLKGNGNLHNQISLWNLHPQLTTLVYRTNCTSWSPECYEEEMPSKMKHWFSHNAKKNILLVLGIKEESVKWGRHENLSDMSHKLLMAYWNKDEGALFVYSNDYNAFSVDKIVKKITSEESELCEGDSVFNVLNNVELPLVKNLGASRTGGISFTSYFGSNVTQGLDSITNRKSELNNIACVGYENGDRVIWGGSKKRGKIWSVKSGSIQDWVEWCDRVWTKLSNPVGEIPEIINEFLRPIELKSYYQGYPIGVQWGEHIQSKASNQVIIHFDTHEKNRFEVEISIENVGSTGVPIQIKFSTETEESIYQLIIDDSLEKGYEYKHLSGAEIKIQYKRGELKELMEHVYKDPFIIYYHDGTYSYNNYHIPLPIDSDNFDINRVETWNWAGIPLNKESMGKSTETDSIQYKTFKEFENDYDFIFNDDGKDEAGDLVALTNIDDQTIKLTLIHCKNAKEAKVSGSIDNMYVVCGQAQKSIRVKHAGLKELQKDLLRREGLWNKDGGASRKLKGDFKTLNYFVDRSRKSKLEFEVSLSKILCFYPENSLIYFAGVTRFSKLIYN